MEVQEINGVRALVYPSEGAQFRTDRDAVGLMGVAFEKQASMIVLPVTRLDPDFFRLKTRLAGEFIEKFVNYRVRLVVLGDISEQMNESTALRDFVRESNRGRDIWFLNDLEQLELRLNRR
jgi:hypothetical protein